MAGQAVDFPGRDADFGQHFGGVGAEDRGASPDAGRGPAHADGRGEGLVGSEKLVFEFALAGFDEKEISVQFRGDYLIFSAKAPRQLQVTARVGF